MSSRGRISLALVLGTAALGLLAAPRKALADRYDLAFINLCKHEPSGVVNGQVSECSWVKRNADGTIRELAFDAEAQSRYRSLMSELGVVMAPRLQTPADTLGFAGFQVTGEMSWTQISNNKDYWNGIEGVPALNTSAERPARWVTTVGAFVRKGIWLPLPAFEVGAGATNLLESHLFALQAYAKLALHEGFHDWAIPSLSVRGSASRVTGTDQVALTILGIDVEVSKQFSLGGTARLEPYGGWNLLFIDARSQVIDATPSCDAYAVNATPAGQKIDSTYCANSQAGTWNDLKANFVFPNQDIITRNRFFVGAKLKFAQMVLIAQYDITTAGGSRDEKQANGAKDESATQQGVTLSGGFDF